MEPGMINILTVSKSVNNSQNYTEIFKEAFKLCKEQGGGTVYVPPGKYLTGSIEMVSNSSLHLDAGAEIIFSNDLDDYSLVKSRWEGKVQDSYMPLVYGRDLVNVSVTGRGVLNGKGQWWWTQHKDKILKYPRPRFISFENCERVLIEGIKLIDSPSWTVTPVNSKNITIHNISIKNPADSPNTDGINPDSCSDVRISDCNVDVGDDCITIKSGVEANPERNPCRNITITNCTLLHGHGGVVIGSEMSGSIQNVVISNCVFNETDRGIRLKSRRGRGGVVEDIRITNIIMDKVMCPIVMNLYYYCGEGGKEKKVWDTAPYPVDDSTPSFRRIHLSGITARNVSASAMFLYGLPESPLSDLSFSDIRIHMKEGGAADYPAMMDRLEPMSQKGAFISYVKNSTFRDFVIENQDGEKAVIQDCSNLEISADWE